ncbi:uncharacterized protein BJ212DRAFT_1309912 [Suillus subaureus]|uniref:Uncharacterized protein n=1 Tax=Suillus subaureus TaxID=48587 RepID=A0A9P7JJX9_9AGAM|nr:uncharacterized protein BJ212DRAFT_1309912 [Suillus subaureus]KAG1827021.1 hypothetical protein BJ212DRAFT_1309912 [Suillus subaureus]
MPRAEALFSRGVAVGVMTYGFISIRILPMDGWIRAQRGGHFQFVTIRDDVHGPASGCGPAE